MLRPYRVVNTSTGAHGLISQPASSQLSNSSANNRSLDVTNIELVSLSTRTIEDIRPGEECVYDCVVRVRFGAEVRGHVFVQLIAVFCLPKEAQDGCVDKVRRQTGVKHQHHQLPFSLYLIRIVQ